MFPQAIGLYHLFRDLISSRKVVLVEEEVVEEEVEEEEEEVVIRVDYFSLARVTLALGVVENLLSKDALSQGRGSSSVPLSSRGPGAVPGAIPAAVPGAAAPGPVLGEEVHVDKNLGLLTQRIDSGIGSGYSAAAPWISIASLTKHRLLEWAKRFTSYLQFPMHGQGSSFSLPKLLAGLWTPSHDPYRPRQRESQQGESSSSSESSQSFRYGRTTLPLSNTEFKKSGVVLVESLDHLMRSLTGVISRTEWPSLIERFVLGPQSQPPSQPPSSLRLTGQTKADLAPVDILETQTPMMDANHTTELVLEYCVYSHLEGGRGIAETERHDVELVVPKTRSESGLGLVLLDYADLVISAAKINLRKEVIAGATVKQIVSTGHGITVFDRVVVETEVVNVEMKGVALLAIEEDRGTPWGGTRFNEALTKQLLKLPLEFLGFENRKAIWDAILNAIVGLELHVVLEIAHERNTVPLPFADEAAWELHRALYRSVVLGMFLFYVEHEEHDVIKQLLVYYVIVKLKPEQKQGKVALYPFAKIRSDKAVLLEHIHVELLSIVQVIAIQEGLKTQLQQMCACRKRRNSSEKSIREEYRQPFGGGQMQWGICERMDSEGRHKNHISGSKYYVDVEEEDSGRAEMNSDPPPHGETSGRQGGECEAERQKLGGMAGQQGVEDTTTQMELMKGSECRARGARGQMESVEMEGATEGAAGQKGAEAMEGAVGQKGVEVELKENQMMEIDPFLPAFDPEPMDVDPLPENASTVPEGLPGEEGEEEGTPPPRLPVEQKLVDIADWLMTNLKAKYGPLTDDFWDRTYLDLFPMLDISASLKHVLENGLQPGVRWTEAWHRVAAIVFARSQPPPPPRPAAAEEAGHDGVERSGLRRLTPAFPLQRSVRQGDPLAPFLFIIVMEALAANLRANKNLRKLQISAIPEEAILVYSMFADDLTLMVDATTENMEEIRRLFDQFTAVSDMTVNWGNKTLGWWIHHQGVRPPELPRVKWLPEIAPVRVLGIMLTATGKPASNDDWILKPALEKLACWNDKYISLIGRALAINNVVLAALWYKSAIWALSKEAVRSLKRQLMAMLWRGNSELPRVINRVAWMAVIQPKDRGGLGILDPGVQVTALMVQWIRRLVLA
ncbi:hypothetical protein CBR_g40656 [Chara braunii]|uniref:Reverse transcriptase domain-containing protein n=1 Tax=Chara braunii TaxID=69332 RepID=A0A388LU51_CHABU|nr:hypothetical protein CBR_g40656 [Chara braunii]|eukprot:GBG85846.1 hypothetical protein CBR_g40656 [Chara braunii]